MKFSESLKKNRDFQYVYKNGKSYANKCLVMYIIPNEQNKNRVGISVSKKGREQCGQASSYAADQRKLPVIGRTFPVWI